MEELERHPNHPSLLAFSDVLNTWGVPNGAYRVDPTELSTIPTPFIAHVAKGKGEFLLVENITGDYYTVSNERLHAHLLATWEFHQMYTGHVLLAEPAPGAGEPNYLVKRRRERVEALRTPFVVIGSLVLLAAFFYYSAYWVALSWSTGLLLVTKSLGLVVSILLLTQSIDAHNPLVQRLCTGGKNRNCTAILASQAAKITEEISWSEVGFFYFAGTWLILLLNGASLAVLQALAVLNLLCLPYTVYSIYYQARVAKQWCVLCCTVQAVLWLEFVALFSFLAQPLTFPGGGEWLALLACLAAPILIWVFLKPHLLRAQQVESLRQQLRRFKYNAGLFAKTLAEQPRHDLPDEVDSIVLGNPTSAHVITVVSNPYCAPCSRAHEVLEEWLTQRDDVRVQVVFATDNDPQAPKTRVASHLTSLNQQNPILIRQALHNWYTQEGKDYEAWAKLYPLDAEPASNSSLQRQREWCQRAAVTATPTILLDGHQLPDLYHLDDVKYLLLL